MTFQGQCILLVTTCSVKLELGFKRAEINEHIQGSEVDGRQTSCMPVQDLILAQDDMVHPD
jgi:hypothetical protein